MLAIAQLAHMKQVPFTYLTKDSSRHVESIMKAAYHTNYKLSREFGMHHVTLSSLQYDQLALTNDFSSFIPPKVESWLGIPQGRGPYLVGHTALYSIQKLCSSELGVATPQAEIGIQQLAQEINEFADQFLGNVCFSVLVF
jgi:hypothetical protein